MRLLLAFLVAGWCIGLVMTVSWGVRRVEDSLSRDVQAVLVEAGLGGMWVEVHDRGVWLNGTAQGWGEAEFARAMAASVGGVQRVHTDSLTVLEPRAPLFPEDGPPPTPEAVRDVLNDLVGDVAFRAGSAIIEPDGLSALEVIGEVLVEQAEVDLFVEGHTDNQGSGDDNVTLSKRRAEAVVESLVSAGVPPQRLKPLGYGGSKPVGDNRTAEGRAQNRRIAFRLKGEPRGGDR